MVLQRNSSELASTRKVFHSTTIPYYTALQYAVASDKIDAAVLLLSYGADPKEVTYGNLPPIRYSKAIARTPERNMIARLFSGVAKRRTEFLNRPEIRKAYELMLYPKREIGPGWIFSGSGFRWHWGKPRDDRGYFK